MGISSGEYSFEKPDLTQACGRALGVTADLKDA